MEKLKTILLVNGAMNRGGAEVMIMNLLRKIHKNFNFIFLINRKKGTQPVGDFDTEIMTMNIPIYYIDAVWDVGVKKYEKQFKEILSQIGKVDIVHSHLNSKGGIISRCAYRCGIKRIIVHCHAKLIFDGSIIRRFANQVELTLQRFWINKYATDYWACSTEALESLFTKTNIHSPNTQVIYNAISVQNFINYSGESLKQELGLQEKDIVIGSIGRIADVKNYKLAADIISQLWNENINIHYVVAGRKQDNDTVEYLFNKLQGDSRFHYLDLRSDIEKIYNGIDIFLGTSLREGLGLSAVEAQASCTTCVLFHGFPKQSDMKIGLVDFINSQNVDDWVSAIKRRIENKNTPSKKEIMSAIQKAGFDIDSEAIRVKNLYNQDCAQG